MSAQSISPKTMFLKRERIKPSGWGFCYAFPESKQKYREFVGACDERSESTCGVSSKSEQVARTPIFRENQSLDPWFLLLRKKARLTTLLGCKRPHDGLFVPTPFARYRSGTAWRTEGVTRRSLVPILPLHP